MSIYETHIIKNPELPFIFHPRLGSSRKHGLGQANWHENIEILFVTDGHGVITSDAEHMEVSSGDTVVINANRLHNFATMEGGFFYRCLIVDRTFCLANHFDTNDVEFEKHFRDAELSLLIERLHEEYALPTDTPFRTQSIRATVMEILAILCRAHSHPASTGSGDSRLLASIKQAIGFIRSESHRDLSLDEVADFVGLSKYYFAREFHRVTGYTFISYLNLIRCENAKRLLSESTAPVGDVGTACGFANRSYFSRTFRSYTGKLPSVWRQSHRSKEN